MTQKQRIINYFISGNKASTLTAAMKGLGVKISTRTSELEREYGVRFDRKPCYNRKLKQRWFEYSLPKKYVSKFK